MSLPCPKALYRGVFVNCEDLLLGDDQLVVTWVDALNPPTITRNYDLVIDFNDGNGFVDQGPSVLYPATQWPTAITIPTDGRNITVGLYWWDDGNVPPQISPGVLDTDNYSECVITTADLNRVITANFGNPQDFGEVTEAEADEFFTDSHFDSYNLGIESLDSLSVVNDNKLRIKFDPITTLGTTASSRTIFQTALVPSPVYEIDQTITLEGPVFDFGGATDQTIKFGFGLGGGSVVTGGGGNDPCGWSFRWITRNNELRGASYAFGRPAGTFAEDIPTGFILSPDTAYDIRMRVGINSSGQSDGFYELFVDGVLLASDYAVEWMDHTQCPSESVNAIDTLLFTNFYGGTNSNTQSWWPDSTQYICFENPIITAMDN